MDENLTGTTEQEGHQEQPRKTLPERLRATQWKPGQSGNPGGRPKSKPFSEALREALDANGGEKLRQVVELYIQDLLTSEKARARIGPELLNRYEGKVMDELEVSGNLITKTLILPEEVSRPDSDCQSPPATAGAPPPDNDFDGKVKAAGALPAPMDDLLDDPGHAPAGT